MKPILIKKGFYFSSVLLLISILYSKFLLSVAMIVLLCLSLIHRRKKFCWRLPKAYWFVILLFAITFVGVVNSSNLSGWFHHVKMKLPFLVLPFAFYNLPMVEKEGYRRLHFFFAILVTLSALPTLIDYIINFEEAQIALGKGQPLSTPIHHVKYSIFMAFSAISLLILYWQKWVIKYSWERSMQLLLALLAIVFLHVLAVRTGIVVFYLCLLSIAVMYALRSRKWSILWATLAVVFILPVLSFFTLPSVYKRLHYMVYDYNKYLEGEGQQYSDAERILSWKMGWKIFRENPIIGIGIGDFKDECTEQYNKAYGPQQYVLYPHNQYLFYLASAGIIGLIIFVTAFAYPFMHYGQHSYLFITLGLVCAFAFCIDNLLERSFGVGFVVYFLCLGVSMHNPRSAT